MTTENPLPRLNRDEILLIPRTWDGGYHWNPADVAQAQADEDWERVKPLVEALEEIGRMPCLADLLGEDSAECRCVPCRAKLARATWCKEES